MTLAIIVIMVVIMTGMTTKILELRAACEDLADVIALHEARLEDDGTRISHEYLMNELLGDQTDE